MRTYIIRRLLLLIPTLLLLTLLIFLLLRSVPGDIIDIMVHDLITSGQNIDLVEAREEISHRLGLDAPITVQYGRWLGVAPQMDGSFSGIFQGDFGTSWWKGRPVIELLLQGWPVTIEIGLMGIILSLLFALPIGIYSALRQDKWGDYIGRSFAILCISVPAFWIGTLIILFPAIWWNYMIPIKLIQFTDDPIGNLRMFIVPAMVLGMAMAGTIMRMTRTMMLETLRQDYIRTAWAKGLRERIVITRHALKNALIPVVTVVGLYMPVMIGGTVIIEQIFMLPGIGRITVEALMKRDYPITSGVMLFFGAGLMLINLMVDLTYAQLDPRVHYK